MNTFHYDTMSPTSADQTPFLLQPERQPGPVAHGLAALLTLLGMEFGWYFWVGEGTGALIWPPAGLAVGLGLVFGWRIVIGPALVVALWGGLNTEGSIWTWTLPALGLLMQTAVAVGGLRWLQGRQMFRGPTRELLGFWLFGPAIAGMVGAGPGVTTLALHTPVFAEYQFMEIFGAYWLAEALGILMVAPVTILLAAALSDRRLLQALEPARWQLLWTGGLCLLAFLQLQMGRAEMTGFAGILVYFYFPLLAVAAGLGQPLFQALATAGIATAFLVQALTGFGGSPPPSDNAEMIEVIVVVTAFIIMTQIVSATSESIRRHLRHARKMARSDYLTGLLNERGMAQALEGHRNGQATLALLDLPVARKIFDLGGLEDADRFEQSLADTLHEQASPHGQAARLGRGLYGLLLPGPSSASRNGLDTLYEHLEGQIVQAGRIPLVLRPAIGAIQIDAEDMAPQEAVALASLASKRAAEQPPPCIRIDDHYSRLLEEERADQATVSAVREALTREEGFELHGQLITPLSDQGDAPPRYELLLRMPDGNGEVLAPAAFLPVAARHRLMPDIDRWVVQRALRLAAARPEAVFTINLSGDSLSDPALGEWIEARRHESGVEAERIWFEITESESVRDPEAAASLVVHLRKSGFRIAIDDFGTGLASFEYIRNFSIDAVKIDGRFIRDLRSEATDRAIVTAIQRLAHETGLSTVAEFVEDEWTIDWLRSAGIDYAQGYAIARPAPMTRE